MGWSAFASCHRMSRDCISVFLLSDSILRGGSLCGDTVKETFRFEALDGMRGICALLIACSHFPAPYLGDQLVLFRHAFVFTNLFFGLSGFILLSVYREKLVNVRHYLSFSGKRIKRLLPVHLVTTVVIVMVPVVAWWLQCLTTWFIPGMQSGEMPPLPWDTYAFLVHLFLLQGGGLLPHLVYNFPAWSLGAILYCSLLMGAVLVFAHRLRIIFFVLFCSVSVYILLKHAPHGIISSHDYGIFRALSCFFLGALAAEIRCRYHSLPPVMVRWLPLLQTLMLMVVLTFMTAVRGDTWMAFGLLPVLTLFLLIFSYDEGDYARALKLPVFRWLSERAYSVFMNQALLLFLGAEVQRCCELLNLSLFNTRVAGTVILALYLFLLLLLSDQTWRHIECRFNKKRTTEQCPLQGNKI
ncbi:acyltransferase [Salmonella enterica]|nr:acyltransferase [Salmonella enterica]ECI6759085.1 acyltransferase [Salmonella enterica subsp. enterica serovar Mbandaka]EJC1536198.1 acyltransferase [Salmonella enterica subsp. enterica serovar Montevideo]